MPHHRSTAVGSAFRVGQTVYHSQRGECRFLGVSGIDNARVQLGDAHWIVPCSELSATKPADVDTRGAVLKRPKDTKERKKLFAWIDRCAVEDVLSNIRGGYPRKLDRGGGQYGNNRRRY
jgi:hypothetical protein